ncbi:TAXI family TRAP transporter solute-binding subunit [Solihabitans fulvus]|uniref:TAXI family TRAP transporter solute-binding subunit n=1 Tax=Solihabitans fulvus TaxID=1892852 RepID=A0A5B2WSZ8_9PSEU|nr:TAXI family TRAP transporter solute-binding subunit [Solihabitans fulvus]KAA2254851.1 TAXI family TRAP transporter solute-binding subunit [Solihabitans fulvus]
MRLRRPRAGATVLATLLAVAGLVSGCRSGYEGLKLTEAAGSQGGVYNLLGKALADAWAGQLQMDRPKVLETRGSVDNLDKLRSGEADVGFSTVDVASDAAAQITGAPGQRQLRALARMHDDYLQLVVRNDLRVGSVADLKDLRVSIGPANSGVEVIANRVLDVDHVVLPEANVKHLAIDDSASALRQGAIDAFFWSGGLPTPSVATLAKEGHVTLLDLKSEVALLRARYKDVYDSATVPASAYGLPGGTATTTLVVRNVLLVTTTMPDDVAEALVRGLFDAQASLEQASPAAKSIDVRSAIETTPIPLHPGAERYYRSIKI